MAKKNAKYNPVRDKAIFWSTYWQAVRTKPDKVRLEVLDAYCQLSFEGTEPELSPEADEVFCLIRPGIQHSLQGYKNNPCRPKADKDTGEVLSEQNGNSLAKQNEDSLSKQSVESVQEQPSEPMPTAQPKPSPYPVTDERHWEEFDF